jgi:hypothetical protein
MSIDGQNADKRGKKRKEKITPISEVIMIYAKRNMDMVVDQVVREEGEVIVVVVMARRENGIWEVIEEVVTVRGENGIWEVIEEVVMGKKISNERVVGMMCKVKVVL